MRSTKVTKPLTVKKKENLSKKTPLEPKAEEPKMSDLKEMIYNLDIDV